jgi:hypothetical protein
MIRSVALFVMAAVIALSSTLAHAQPKTLHVLALYSTNVEADHVQFAQQALQFFVAAAAKDHFDFKSSTNWDDLNDPSLSQYQVVLWLNAAPATERQRLSFQHYMEHGGAWLGFHAAGYNDESTHWPWFVDFLGGAVFYGNSWPPLPAKLIVDEKTIPSPRISPRVSPPRPTSGTSGSPIRARTKTSKSYSRSIPPITRSA